MFNICCPNVIPGKGEHLNLTQFEDEWVTTNGLRAKCKANRQALANQNVTTAKDSWIS